MKKIIVFCSFCLLFVLVACSSKEKRWGKEFDLQGKWWEQNGQSYDPNTKMFLAVGMSRGNYGNMRLERDSADMDSRKQVANFMQTMVSSYVKECTVNSIDASENMVKAVSREILVGSAIVDRHYDESQKLYYALVKVNLKYFFEKVSDRVIDSSNKTIVEKYSSLDPEEREKRSSADIEELKAKVVKVEDAVSRKAEEVTKAGGTAQKEGQGA